MRKTKVRLGDGFSANLIDAAYWSVMLEPRRASICMVATKWPSTTTFRPLLIESSNALDV
jgi:hypothetical protein